VHVDGQVSACDLLRHGLNAGAMHSTVDYAIDICKKKLQFIHAVNGGGSKIVKIYLKMHY